MEEGKEHSTQILHMLHRLDGRMDDFAEGQKELKASVANLEEGQKEIHEMLHVFSTEVDGRFDAVETRMDRIELRVTGIESRVTGIESNVAGVESKVSGIETRMVTKDYLDDKLADHGSRYGELIRKTNGKIETLADCLVAEGSLSSKSAETIVLSEPFARKGN